MTCYIMWGKYKGQRDISVAASEFMLFIATKGKENILGGISVVWIIQGLYGSSRIQVKRKYN